MDPFGHTTRLYYQQANNVFQLVYVVDVDGQTNTLYHANSSFPTRITSVKDQFGNVATLQYDATVNGCLTNVTDVAGNSASFSYDSNGSVTNLTTPYGRTRFETFYPGFNSPNFIRAIRVLDAAGGTNVYVLTQNATMLYLQPIVWFLRYGPNPGQAPTNYPTATFDNAGDLTYRNSFHWGPRQAGALPVDLTQLGDTNFINARFYDPNGAHPRLPRPWMPLS